MEERILGEAGITKGTKEGNQWLWQLETSNRRKREENKQRTRIERQTGRQIMFVFLFLGRFWFGLGINLFHKSLQMLPHNQETQQIILHGVGIIIS